MFLKDLQPGTASAFRAGEHKVDATKVLTSVLILIGSLVAVFP